MANEKRDLTSKFIRDTTNKDYYDKKMAPAANENGSDTLIALNYDTRSDSTLAAVGAANMNSSLAVARAMFEEQQRKHKDAEEKILAIVRARQIEAMKVQELDLARAIRRHHEDEQVQKHLLSLHRERELLQQDPKLFSRGVPIDGKIRTDGQSRKRLLEDVLQRKPDGITLWNDIQTVTRIGNEDDKLLPMKIPRHQTMISPGASRLLPMNFENSIISLPLSSQSPSQTSLQPQSMSLTPSFSPRTPFLEDQATSLLHQRNTAQFNRKDFNNDEPETILNSLYSSARGHLSSNQNISSLRKYYDAVNASSFPNKNIPILGTNLHSMTHVRVGTNWLHSSTPGIPSNSSLMCASIPQEEKRTLERQHDLIGDSNRTKTPEKYSGINADTSNDLEADQQQKRFNKHQCKQWTLKFHELLAFKERTGHCNVPHGYKENLALAMWVKRQRHQYNLMMEKKTSTLTGERIKLLENIGFVWNCLETAWEQHFQDLCHFVMHTGHCAVPSTYKRNPRLASWVVTQRRQCKLLEDGKQSSMTPKRLEKLKQIGFPVKTKPEGKA